jgi:hypothetical protein
LFFNGIITIGLDKPLYGWNIGVMVLNKLYRGFTSFKKCHSDMECIVQIVLGEDCDGAITWGKVKEGGAIYRIIFTVLALTLTLFFTVFIDF